MNFELQIVIVSCSLYDWGGEMINMVNINNKNCEVVPVFLG